MPARHPSVPVPRPRRRAGVALVVAVATLAQAACASASISVTRSNSRILVARNDGTHAKPVGLATSSFLSPNGKLVALRGGDHCAPTSPMQIVDVASGASVLAHGFYLGCMPNHPAWSHDSKTLYSVRADDRDGTNSRLVAVDAATGVETVLPSGSGQVMGWDVSLSPDGTRLAFIADVSAPGSLAFRTALRVLNLHSRTVQTLRTGKLLSPVFGPTRIAFSVSRGSPASGFSVDTAVIGQNGRGYRVLTHARANRSFTPIGFSANGTRLLGATNTGSVAINPRSGAVRTLSRTILPAVLSRNGRFMLGYSQSGSGINPGNTWRIAWARGGARTMLFRHATFPSLSQ